MTPVRSSSCTLILLALAWAGTAPAAGAEATAPWLAEISRDVSRQEYFLSPGDGAGFSAPNRAQGLRTRWQDGAIVVTPRADQSAWSFRYELADVGRGASPRRAAAVSGEKVENGRIEWTRGAHLSEWYVNDARGIEQGFVLEERPDGPAGEPIAFDGRIDGLLAHPSDDGQSILLRTPAGVDAMRLGHLVVVDASGAVLPSCFAVASGTLSILVDDRDAAYPVTVDPLMTSPAWTIEGLQADANLGFSVATAGDVNGDGYSDVIVGAPSYDGGQTSEGAAFVHHGSAAGPSTRASWAAESDVAGAFFGHAVATAGDVNGDGFADVIVGARLLDRGQSNEGGAFVYHGSAAGLSPAAAWTAEGDQASAFFGYSVATAGDVNGDAFSDVIVGAPAYDNGQSGEGRAFVYRGSPTGLSAVAAWTAEPNQANAFFGYSVATAGDVNGDGFSDVVVGADAFDNGEAGEGRAFAYHGSAAGLLAAAAWTAEADQIDAQFGYSVATAGDVNGDGYSDVIVGARWFDAGSVDAGRAFVYAGSATGLSRAASWTAEGDQADAQFGASVACAGDVNGDGLADVIVGAPVRDGGEIDEGAAFVYLGATAGLARTATWSIESDQGAASLGGSVATAGDVNGDGYSDVIVGTPFHDGAEPGDGRASVYAGSAAGLAATAAWTAEGGQDDAYLGDTVAAAGDVNGDGYSDVIVGVWGYDGGDANEGRALLYLGSPSGLLTTPGWIAESDQAEARFGQSLGAAGDVNGDGYSDVIVGSPGFDGGDPDEGRAFAYLGSAGGLSATPAWIAECNQPGAGFGSCVETAGDVDGDGFSDLVIAAERYTNGQLNEGRVFLYRGSSSGPGTAATWTAESDQAGAYMGRGIACAGDVDADGYSDVIVSAPGFDDIEVQLGRAFLYRGSPTGLEWSPSWTVQGSLPGALLGNSVGSAGDVNGDGYSDVIVGVVGFDNGAAWMGRVHVYHGSAAGLSPAASWLRDGDQFDGLYGGDVATAGDVNGDGYSDVVVGAYGHDGRERNTGLVDVFLGSPTGLTATPAWTAMGDQEDELFGSSVATAGDVNGDGYSDILVGASQRANGEPYEGAAFLYHGNASDGLDRIPRQRRADDSAPIDLLGLGDATNGFGIHLRARSPFGRDHVRLEAEVEPLGIPFDGAGLLMTPYTDTGIPGAGGSFVDLSVVDAPLGIGPHRWRVRLRGMFPFPWQSHWMTMPLNAVTETDLRVTAPTCDEPSALDLGPGATPLLVAKALVPDTVTLIWESVGAPRYHVYGGNIADLGPARPVPEQVACNIPTNASDAAAIGPGRWYVAVAACATMESSYGRDSYARERDPSPTPCP